MTYEDKLQDRVSEHPMAEFAAMGDLSEMDNFGDQFAELLNALSTNVIIPTEDEDELKQWVADHAGGEPVYAEIDGELRIAEPLVASPSGPDDIGLESVGSGGEVTTDTVEIEESGVLPDPGYNGSGLGDGPTDSYSGEVNELINTVEINATGGSSNQYMELIIETLDGDEVYSFGPDQNFDPISETIHLDYLSPIKYDITLTNGRNGSSWDYEINFDIRTVNVK